MTRERYQELLEALLEDELSPDEAAELVAGLRDQPDLSSDLRRHLALWNAWEQRVAGERSAESFVAAWKTRAGAEAETGRFAGPATDRIPKPGAALPLRMPFWRRWTRAWQVGFALLALAFISLASWFVYDQTSNAGPQVAITGEGVCQWCVLGVTNRPGPAIRVVENGTTNIIYLDLRGYTFALHRYFGGGTTVKAEGVLHQEGDRQVLETDAIEVNGVRLP